MEDAGSLAPLYTFLKLQDDPLQQRREKDRYENLGDLEQAAPHHFEPARAIGFDSALPTNWKTESLSPAHTNPSRNPTDPGGVISPRRAVKGGLHRLRVAKLFCWSGPMSSNA